jgi:pimeloyl-ACP methyl ester carboxylesterase
LKRRDFIGAGILTPVLSATATGIEPSHPAIVLVHGAGHGGWCWSAAAEQLRSMGYPVYTPTLTGMGERVHLRSPDITLHTHIDDIVNVIEWEELNRIILVGHSYGGTIITGVCDRIPERIAQVIFIDANTPRDGEPTIPNLTPERVEQFTGQPLKEGYLLPLMDPLTLGIDPEDEKTIAWLQRRLTEQPIRTVSEPVQLTRGGTDGLPRTFVLTTPMDKLQEWQRDKVLEIKEDPSWDYREMLVGHDAMIIAPTQTAALLDKIARQPA